MIQCVYSGGKAEVMSFRMYQDKLAQLKKQLQQLKEGTLPEYMKKLKKLDQQYRERLRINEVWLNYEVSSHESHTVTVVNVLRFRRKLGQDFMVEWSKLFISLKGHVCW